MDSTTPQIPDRHKAAHFETKVISRGKGQSVIAAAAYRSCERLADERLGTEQDYRAKGGLRANLIVGPEGSAAWTTEQLWNAADKAEDKMNKRWQNATVAREFVISLPNELPTDKAVELCRGYAAYLHKTHGVAVMASLHDPDKKDTPLRDKDQEASEARYNLHCHFLLTTRTVGIDTAGQPVFGAKTTQFDDRDWSKKTKGPSGKETIIECRQQWAIMANQALDDIGFVGPRVDLRSHEDRAKALGHEPIAAPKERHHGPKRTIEKRRYERKAARIENLGQTPPPPPGWLKAHDKTKSTRNRLAADLRRAVLTAANGQDLDAARAAEAAAKAAAAPPPPPPIKKKPQPPTPSIFGPGGLIALRSAKTIAAEKKQEAETKRAIEQDQKAAERRHLAAEKDDTQRQEQEAKAEERQEERRSVKEAAEDAWAAKQEADAETWRENEEAKAKRFYAKEKAKDRGSDR